MKLVKKRIIAFLIDYALIMLYALMLAGSSLVFHKISGIKPDLSNPVIGQMVGFFTLTLPVFLYFYLSEKGAKRATLGKRKAGIIIVSDKQSFTGTVLLRNVIKFMPWEIAHTGVHWIVFYSLQNEFPPLWVFIVLIIPQLTVLVYFISIIASKGESSAYDRVAGSKVEEI